MAGSYTMKFTPWKYDTGSNCTFNLYKLRITDFNNNMLEVSYTLDSGQNKWIRGTQKDTIVDADLNKLDFISDDF